MKKELKELSKYAILKRKGYIIHKKYIKTDLLLYIQDILTVSPKVHKDYVRNVKSFPVFFENKKKIFLPSYWAFDNIGKPNKDLIKDGLSFNEELKTVYDPRDYQKPIIKKVLQQLQEIKGSIITLPCGEGKCMGFNTPIMMYDGTIKMVQDIKVGEQLMGDDSTPRNVLSLARGRETLYKVIPKKGTPYIVNESHILSLKCSTKNKFGEKGSILDIPLKDYLKLPKSYHGKGSTLTGYKVGITFPEKEVPIDPYIIGFWLGDVCSSNTMISNQDAIILKYLKEKVKEYDCYLQYHSQYDYRINGIKFRNNLILKSLKELNLINNKHIPDIYKINSRENRLKLLAGLIDSDGSYSNNCYEITQKNNKLSEDIVYLCRSLGFACFNYKKKSCWIYKGIKKTREYNRIKIYGSGLENIPILCSRKKAHTRKQIKNSLHSLITLKKLEVGDYYGFVLDGNHRYLLGDFTVTHNTFLAIHLATLLKQKTLIVVHTSVLLTQWIERLNEFIPNAKVGIIKGKKFEVEGKDFVIAMLQTLISESRGYDYKTFINFGTTIVDEVHHISAPSFSRALPIITTKYKIGLSATPERNDKLENIFYWYLGPSAWYNRENKNTNTIIKVINYVEENFKEIKMWNGGYNLAKMVTQIIENKKRNYFIIRQIKYFSEFGRQLIILSTRRNHLIELKELFEQNITIYKSLINLLVIKYNIDNQEIIDNINSFLNNNVSLGMYIGGMKTTQLEISSKCGVIFATYQLVSEGTDIPTLNTLIMTSPKKQVEQVIGRIQRGKNNFVPLVIDMCDMFSVYENQGKFRQRHYRKQKYNIEYIDFNSKSKKFPLINHKKIIMKKKIREKIQEIEFKSCLISSD